MRHKYCKYYFCQFWAFENAQVLTDEKLRKVLFKIWREVWRHFNMYRGEDKLMLITQRYKQRILKGKTP